MPSRSPADIQRERKRKNADAQAQFRQRRANYISSLEETVTKLEAVVLELQDSLRDAKNETLQERRTMEAMIEQLRQEHKTKEAEWRTAWQSKLPSTPYPGGNNTLPSPISLPPVPQSSRGSPLPSCLDPNLRFGLNLKDRPQLPRHLEENATPFAFNLASRPPPIVGPQPHPMNMLPSRPPSSAYNTGGPSQHQGMVYRTGEEGHHLMHPPPPSSIRRGTDSGFELPHTSLFIDSAQTGMTFVPRPPSVFSAPPDLSHSLGRNGRSISPHSPHESPTSTATSASSQLHFLPDLPPNDVESMHGLKAFGAMPGHDPTQVMSTFSLADTGGVSANRRPELRRTSYPGSDPFPLPQVHLPPAMTSANPLRSASPISATESAADQQHSAHLDPGPSRSNARHRSSSPPISNTLAVIKAQAFGALRRNRTHKKRSNGHATKVALEALEARGLNLGLEPSSVLSTSYQDMEDEAEVDTKDMSIIVHTHLGSSFLHVRGSL